MLCLGLAYHAMAWLGHGVLRRGIAQCTVACNALEFGAVSWQVLAYHEVAWLDYCAVPWLDVA